MTNIPEGWTDDLSVSLPSKTSVDEVVKFVIEESFSRKSAADIINALASLYGISSEDASLVLERVWGGISRASTNNPSNQPNAKKDPFAYSSYEMSLKNREIIAFFYPDRVQKSEVKPEIMQEKEKKHPWWKFW